MTQEYKNYIDGKWVASSSGEIFENINPANCNEVVGRFQKSNKQDVEKAIAAAANARRMWKATPAPKRGEILYRVAEMMVRDKESLAQDMTREMGKPYKESLDEVDWCVHSLRYSAEIGRNDMGRVMGPATAGQFHYTLKQPLGVAAMIMPFNYPMVLLAWEAGAALAAGNAVVVSAAPGPGSVGPPKSKLPLEQAARVSDRAAMPNAMKPRRVAVGDPAARLVCVINCPLNVPQRPPAHGLRRSCIRYCRTCGNLSAWI